MTFTVTTTVLFFLISGHLRTQEFHTPQACQNAVELIEKKFGTGKAFCVKK